MGTSDRELINAKRTFRTILQALTGFALVGFFVTMVLAFQRYAEGWAVEHASNAAYRGLRASAGSLNGRLNELREELVHLNAEQANLARALTEGEREKLVFYRRDYLAAFAIMVQGADNQWELQKYYLRNRITVAPSSGGNDKNGLNAVAKHAKLSALAADLFRAAMTQVRAPGFWMKRVDARSFGASWGGTGEEGVAIAFLSADDAGRPYGLVAVLKPSYVFSFCRFFSSQSHVENSFVLDERGRVICHSEPRHEGTNLSEFGFYTNLTSAEPAVGDQADPNMKVAHYFNLSGNEVMAAIRSIEPGFLLVDEVKLSQPLSVPILLKVSALGLAICALMAMALLFLPARASRQAPEQTPEPTPKEPARRADDLQNSAKPIEADREKTELAINRDLLQKEVRELQETVLLLQTGRAFTASYLKSCVDHPLDRDLVELTLSHLRTWRAPGQENDPWHLHIAWLEFGTEDTGSVFRLAAAGSGEQIGFEKLFPGEAPRPPFADGVFQDAFFRERLSEFISSKAGVSADFVLQPVSFGEHFLGLLAVSGVLRDGLETEYLDCLPQIGQIFGAGLFLRNRNRQVKI